MPYTFALNREQLVERIARKLGVAEAGQAISGEDSAVIVEAIDVRLKELPRYGIQWHNVAPAETSVTLTAGVATASLSAVTDFGFAVSAMLTVGTDQQEVEIIGHRTYQAIPDKTERGEPIYAMFAGGSVYLWPVPQSNGSLKITYQAKALDSAAATSPDIPIDIIRPFTVLCAADLADDFQLPTIKAQHLMAQMPEAIRDIKAITVERTDTITVESESY